MTKQDDLQRLVGKRIESVDIDGEKRATLRFDDGSYVEFYSWSDDESELTWEVTDAGDAGE